MNNVKISADTIARTIVLGIALANQLFAASGHAVMDIGNDEVYQLVSVLCTIAASVTAWWKNNSFTTEAIKADRWMKREKGKTR